MTNSQPERNAGTPRGEGDCTSIPFAPSQRFSALRFCDGVFAAFGHAAFGIRGHIPINRIIKRPPPGGFVQTGFEEMRTQATFDESHFPQPDLDEAARAADATREATGAVVASRLG